MLNVAGVPEDIEPSLDQEHIVTDVMVIGARGIPDVEGGAEKNAEAVFPLLVERGYAIELLAMRRFVSMPSYRGVKLTAFPTLRFANTDKVVYLFFALIHAARKRPRLVHLQGLNSAFLLGLFKLAGLKVVVRYGSADHQYSKWSFIGRAGFRFCERQLALADQVIAVSAKYKSDLDPRCGADRVHVVPNGIDASSVSDEAAQFWATLGLRKRRYVLAVGRLSVDKDYATLIDAFMGLHDPDLRLVIAGGASEDGYAEALRERAGSRVLFLGRVKRRLLAGLYANCGAYVNCSRHEGLSNAVLEAVSHGCPVILSDIPANLDTGLDAANYFPVGDAAALCERLASAIADHTRFVPGPGHFLDWSDVAARTEAVYSRVVPGFGARVPPRDTSHETRGAESVV
jgi:glycosyltransferase involved in cell wall biosynthesis